MDLTIANRLVPSYTGIRVYTIDEANQLFHAVSLGKRYLFSRRLTTDERRGIHTGCVFIWEERNPNMETTGEGIERWTDGRRWSCSRIKDSFLYYTEKLPEVDDPVMIAAMAQNRLIKQTYSVKVNTPGGRRKWHLVAYFTEETSNHLRSVNDLPDIAAIRHLVPAGAYKQARLPRGRAARHEAEVDEQAEDPPQMLEPPAALTPTPVASTSSHLASMTTSYSHLLSHSWQADPDTKPELAPLVSPLRPDPNWIMKNFVAVCPDIMQAQSRGLLGTDASKDLAPLVYMRQIPYSPRHQLDNDALRSFDSVPWMVMGRS